MLNFLQEGFVFHKRYLIKKKIGGGGMGTIYLAEQTDANRLVALKLLHTDLIASEEDRQRFIQEFKMLSKLSDEHIVTFFTASISDEGIPYAACEYLEGQSLKQVINSGGQLSFARTLNVINQIANAISVAHAQGIVHRDLKPENIMLLDKPEKDWVKVLDFGLSKFSNTDDSSAQQKLTQTGALVGTVSYMSPEQCLGRVLDQRSDIYSLGCIAFECLSGEPLFQADTPLGILHKHLNEDADQSLRKLRLNCPSQFICVLQKMLKKSPEERFQSMDELIAELSERSLLAETAPADKKLRYKILLAASIAVAIAVAAISGSFVVNTKKQAIVIDPALSRTADTAMQLYKEGKISKAYELLNRWLKAHENVNNITLAEAWYNTGKCCSDDIRKISWFSKSKEYFKKYANDSEIARKRLREIIPTLIELHIAEMHSQRVENEIQDAMILFDKTCSLAEFHPFIAKLVTRSAQRKQLIRHLKSYVDLQTMPSTSVVDLSELSMQLADCFALEADREAAEQYYRKALVLLDQVRMKDEQKADIDEAHILRRLVLLDPAREAGRANFVNALKGKRADNWAAWYILWGSADEQEDFNRALIYARKLLDSKNRPAGALYTAYMLEKVSIHLMRQGNPAYEEAINQLLKEVANEEGRITPHNYCLLLSVEDEARSTRHQIIAKKIAQFISRNAERIGKGVDEEVYKALINPFSKESQKSLENVDWFRQPLWSNFMAEEAVFRIDDQIKNLKGEKDLERIFEQIPEALRKNTRDFYAVEFKGFLYWRYAQILERERHEYKQAAEFYRKSVEIFNMRPAHFPDDTLSYDNINWRRIRSSLSRLACEGRKERARAHYNSEVSN